MLSSQLQVVTKQSRSLTLNLHNKNGRGGARNLGTLTVHAEETIASRSVVDVVFRCSNLDNKDLFSKSVCIFLAALLRDIVFSCVGKNFYLKFGKYVSIIFSIFSPSFSFFNFRIHF